MSYRREDCISTAGKIYDQLVYFSKKEFEIHMDRMKRDIDKRFTALEGGADKKMGQRNSDEGESDKDATLSEKSSNRLESERELEDGEASLEWEDIYPELDIEFGEVLSQAEILEAERKRFGEIESEIELEFELHDMEEDEQVDPETVHGRDENIVEKGLVDAQKILEDDTLILNTDELSEEGTLVLSADELAAGRANDLANPDRAPEKEAPNHMKIDSRRAALNLRSNENRPSREEQVPSKKWPITAVIFLGMAVIAVILVWWWL